MSRVKMNLSMPKETRDRLTALRVNSGAASDSEVVRRALAVYELLIAEQAKGGTIVIHDRDGEEREVMLVP